MRMGPVSFSALFTLLPIALCAQRNASLGVGTGVVRSASGSSFSVLTVSPAAQWLSPWTYIGAGGALSLLEQGVWATQARVDLWTGVARRQSGIQPAISATLAASTRSDGVAGGSGGALVEAVRGNAALGVGAVTGVIEDVPGVGALRLRARGWWQTARVPAQVSASVEATRLLGSWYSDAVAGVTVENARIVGSVWLSGRVSEGSAAAAAGSASFQYYLTPQVAFEMSGGNYLRDPFQGLPQAGFLTGGIRIFTSKRSLTPAPASVRRPAVQPLVAQRRGDTLVVRFRMPGAQAVAIAGNWNTWTPAPLRRVGDEIWEAVLDLRPGVYHFNLVVDGEWVVPGGVATISDGMGGLLAILNVL